MNKKFSTLAVGLLLAGGLFSTAEAQTKVWPVNVAGNGFYHVLKVHDSDATAPYGSSYSVDVNNGALVQETNFAAVDKGNAWKVTAVKVNGIVVGFEFTNANGSKLQFDASGKFTTKASDAVYSVFKFDGTILKAVDGSGSFVTDKYLKQVESGYELAAGGTHTVMYTLPVVKLGTEVNDLLEDGFSITIGKQKEKDGKIVWDGAHADLQGNVFTGKLTLESDGTLTTENGKKIVLTTDTWGTLSNSLQATDNKAGFKFAAYSPAEMRANADKIKAKTFTVSVPNAITDEPVTIVAGSEFELMVATINGVNYLTTGDAALTPASDPQLVGDASYTYKTDGSKVLRNTYVTFGDGNDVDYAIFNDALWNISWKDADGKVLVAGPSNTTLNNEYYGWVPAAQVATAYPEGQWLWNGAAFINRESGVKLEINGLRKIDGKELVFSKGDNTYTFVKAGTPGHTTTGYLNGTDDEFLKEAFYIGTPVKATDDTVYIAKDAKNALYLTLDKAAAVEFRMSKYIEVKAGVTTDLIHHYTTYASSKTNTGVATDTLCLHKYWVSEASTGAELAYDPDNQKFVLSSTDDYDAIVFKNKAEGVYNLVQDLYTTQELKDGKLINLEYGSPAFCNASKLYGAHNTAELKQADKAYAYVANDLFILEKVEAGQYVSGIEGKNIKIMRNVDNNYVLYESGSLLSDANNEAVAGFLAIQNFLDPAYAEKKAALYVDTATGMSTWRPEYMLVLDPKVVPAGKWCPIHGDDPTCPDAHKVETRGYVEGRYLVNLVDSAANRADCVFQNYNTFGKYYRLGFVQAKHIGDTLAIASTGDSLNLTGNDFTKMNVAEFAFHYTDANRDAFTIETAYTAKIATAADVLNGSAENVGELIRSRQGYVKFHNGIPVVTRQESEAEVFVLAETEEAPTANEAVAAAEVSVVAVNGAIIVKGAAGKVVTVANILGQTIANQVAASDNVTIAAPAGIAVVTVDGEATKVVVK